MKRLRVLMVVAGVFLISVLFGSIWSVHAAGFSVAQHTEYTINKDYALIRKTTTIKNNSQNQYIAGSETQILNVDFFSDSTTEKKDLTLESLKTSDQDYVLTVDDNAAKVTMSFGLNLNPGETKVFWIEYKDYQLLSTVGAVSSFYIPKQQVLDGGRTYDISRTFRVNIPKEFGSEIFTQIEPSVRSETSEFIVFDYLAVQLFDTSVHIQIGDFQFYNFEISLKVPQTHDMKVFTGISKNEVTVALPRDFDETGQVVYIESFSPEPKIIYQDELGNVFATFLLNADQSYDISIKGYISIKPKDKELPVTASFSDIPEEYNVYLQDAAFWEVNSTTVEEAVITITSSSDIIDIINSTYSYVVDTLEYDDKKHLDNDRAGAVATLSGAPSVCMEYADLMITLLRAQGVPAIAAYGRGFNPDLPATEQDNHQWVLAYVPNYGWLTVDPTWGEGGRSYIGPDLERVLWYVAGTNPQTPAPVSHRSVDIFQLEKPVVSFTPVETIDVSKCEPLSSLVRIKDNSVWTEFITRIEISIFPRLFDTYFVVFALFGAILLASIIISMVKIVTSILRKFSSKPVIISDEQVNTLPSDKGQAVTQDQNGSVFIQPSQRKDSPEAKV